MAVDLSFSTSQSQKEVGTVVPGDELRDVKLCKYNMWVWVQTNRKRSVWDALGACEYGLVYQSPPRNTAHISGDVRAFKGRTAPRGVDRASAPRRSCYAPGTGGTRAPGGCSDVGCS